MNDVRDLAATADHLAFGGLDSWRQHAIVAAYCDGDGYACTVAAHPDSLGFVSDNVAALRKRGIYEAALIAAYTGCRTNFSGWSLAQLVRLFEFADRGRLQALGAPMPATKNITIYRGVAGVGRARRVRGLSWTRDSDVACWFALRMELPDPAVFLATISRDQAYCRLNDRGEDEIIAQPHQWRRLALSPAAMAEGQTRFQRQKAEAKERMFQKLRAGRQETDR